MSPMSPMSPISQRQINLFCGRYTFFDDNVAVYTGFSGNNNGESLTGSVIKSETLDKFDAVGIFAQSGTAICHQSGIGTVAGNRLHHGYRICHILIGFDQLQNRLEQIRGTQRIGMRDTFPNGV